MPEQKLAELAQEIEDTIKIGLLKEHMTQIEMARLINEGQSQVNRAVKGDMSPKSIAIRQKIYKRLDIKE